jgi:hypothetical protein
MVYHIDDSLIPGRDYAEHVIRMEKRIVRQEDALPRLITYTTWSAHTFDPINLGLIAPTSEGKTYPVMQATNFVDRNDVWIIGSMTPKVLVRQKGVLVDRDNQPIGGRLKKLRRTLRSKEASQEAKDEAYEEMSELKENAKSLIDLSGKTLVFLEPPQRELWNITKPMLSHDSWEIEFPYVDKSDVDGIHVKHIVVRGWPACIFCSAKDESLWPGWKEIERVIRDNLFIKFLDKEALCSNCLTSGRHANLVIILLQESLITASLLLNFILCLTALPRQQ